MIITVGTGSWVHALVHADGGFDVPEINDDFNQFEQKTPVQKEQPVQPPPVKEEKGFFDSVTESLSKVGDWFEDKISGAWEWTKEKAAAFWDWFTEICSKIAEVVIDALSAAWDWIVKFKEYIAFAGVLILGIVLCIFATPLGIAVLSGMALSFVISMALNGWEINKMTFVEAAIGGLLGLIGGGITAGASRGLASSIGQKLIMGVKNSKILGPVLQGGQKLVSKLPAPMQKVFGRGGAIGAVEGAGTSVADDILHGRKINWKNAFLAGVFGAGSVAVVHFAQPVVNKAVASMEPVLAKTPIVKNVFNKVGDCVAVRQTGGYHALIDIPVFECFYAPDGVGGGGNSSSKKTLTLKQRRENVKNIAVYTDLSEEGLKGKGYKLNNGAIIKGQKIVKVNSMDKYIDINKNKQEIEELSLEYVSKLRKELGLPSLEEDVILVKNKILKSGNTVAVLEVDGKRIWGRNGWGDDSPKKYQEMDKEWFDSRPPKQKGTNWATKYHAEGDVFWHLYKYRKKNKILGGKAVMAVDRPLCNYCKPSGSDGVRQMMAEVGLEELEVISPSGTEILKVDKEKLRKSW